MPGLGCAARDRDGYTDVVKPYKTLAAKSKRPDHQVLVAMDRELVTFVIAW
jgi:hypothetical protein